MMIEYALTIVAILTWQQSLYWVCRDTYRHSFESVEEVIYVFRVKDAQTWGIGIATIGLIAWTWWLR